MNVLHRRTWAGMALASLGLILATACALGTSRAESPQPPDIWEVQGVWVHDTGIKLAFRMDGTYEMTVPIPFTSKVLRREWGIFDVAEGVIYAESSGGDHLRMTFDRLGPEEAIFRITRNEKPAGELILTHMP